MLHPNAWNCNDTMEFSLIEKHSNNHVYFNKKINTFRNMKHVNLHKKTYFKV